MRAARKFQRLGRDRQGGQAGEASVLDWLLENFRSIYARGARGNLLPAPPAPARVEASTQLSTSDRLRDEEVAKLRAEVDDLRLRQAIDDLRLGTVTPQPRRADGHRLRASRSSPRTRPYRRRRMTWRRSPSPSRCGRWTPRRPWRRNLPLSFLNDSCTGAVLDDCS